MNRITNKQQDHFKFVSMLSLDGRIMLGKLYNVALLNIGSTIHIF